jgi:glycosyltransferase involved in cell wall biosynthesis
MSFITSAERPGLAMSSAPARYRLTVGYDASALVRSDGGTGKGTYLRNLLGDHISTFVGLAPENDNPSELPLRRRGKSGYLCWQQSSLVRLLFSRKPNVFLAPYNTAPLLIPSRTRLLLVLHDLILMQRFSGTGLRQQVLNYYRSCLIGPAVRRAAIVVTVSDYSRQEILRRFPRANVRVIPNTISESWFVQQRSIPMSERGNYLLMVTATVGHKNVDRALQAFALYAKQVGSGAARLRIAGISGAAALYLQKAASLGISNLVTVEPYLSEPELQNLYRHAAATLVPSLMEGFGIPVLEGMASATPVICSNTTSLPEVAGDAAAYFEPTNAAEMASSIRYVMGDPALRSSMVSKGLRRAMTYHPSKVQRQVEQFWREIAETMDV